MIKVGSVVCCLYKSSQSDMIDFLLVVSISSAFFISDRSRIRDHPRSGDAVLVKARLKQPKPKQISRHKQPLVLVPQGRAFQGWY